MHSHPDEPYGQSTLNTFAALAADVRNSLRKAIQEVLRDESSILYREDAGVISADQVTMHVPMKIGGFTDFMCSLEHVQTVSQATLPPLYESLTKTC
jgi:fumarylacetoacetase